MTDLLSLYRYAEENGIDVDWFPMEQASSLSVPLPDDTYAIALDPWKLPTIADETVRLGHELGHCETCSFYNRWAALDIRQKHENRADKWAIKKLIPKDELETAIVDGRTELWELAELFGVTESFMLKALCWYRNGNLAVDIF
ncbi:ImmA/IrrE family metallo-endopeptidase [uncultured Mailhella sp.]|uniref:ImmA/IrrE family metallo-endopeptidase n=1 Tax=uncultured Mailhella sp. TaxID=1981031 RepID=UPI0026293F7B|nr:ImmA/IrrE family metallo-endopeptidase [uncultured Mailhella sp.]